MPSKDRHAQWGSSAVAFLRGAHGMPAKAKRAATSRLRDAQQGGVLGLVAGRLGMRTRGGCKCAALLANKSTRVSAARWIQRERGRGAWAALRRKGEPLTLSLPPGVGGCCRRCRLPASKEVRLPLPSLPPPTSPPPTLNALPPKRRAHVSFRLAR